MNYFFILLGCLALFPASVAAQQHTFTGTYYMPGTPGDGGGGATMVIEEDHFFALVAYATLITGRWELIKDQLILHPDNPEEPFTVYGRYNPDIKDGIKVMFSEFDEDTNYIGFNQDAERNAVLQLVMNADANCVPWPVVYTFSNKEKAKSVWLATENDRETEGQNPASFLYEYELPEKYNDFIFTHYPSARIYPDFTFSVSAAGLEDRYGGKMNKKELNEEDRYFLKEIKEQHSAGAFASREKLYSNAGYNFPLPLPDNEYVFDTAKQAYLSTYNKYEHLAADDFHNLYAVLAYKKVKTKKQWKASFQKSEKQWLNFTCDGNAQ